MISWRFSCFYFVFFCSVGIFIPYWGLYLQYRGFTPTEIGGLMSILLLTKIVAPNVWASIADNLKASTGSSLGLLKLATGMNLLIFCLIFWAQGYWAVAIVMFGFCVFWNACLPQLEAATLNHLSGNKHHYGRIRLWGSVSFIITVTLVGRLIDYKDAGIVFPALVLTMLVLFMSSFFLSSEDEEVLPAQHDVIPIRKLITPGIIALLCLCFFMQLTHAPFYTFFSIYLQDFGYTKTQIGWLWSTGVLFEIAIFIAGFRILSAFPLRTLLCVTFFTASFRWYLVAQFPQHGWVIFFSQVLHAITYGLYHSVMIQLIDRFFQGRYQIRGQALYGSLTYGLGGAVGSFGSGYIWTLMGKQALFMMGSIIMLIVALVSVLLIQHTDMAKQGV